MPFRGKRAKGWRRFAGTCHGSRRALKRLTAPYLFFNFLALIHISQLQAFKKHIVSRVPICYGCRGSPQQQSDSKGSGPQWPVTSPMNGCGIYPRHKTPSRRHSLNYEPQFPFKSDLSLKFKRRANCPAIEVNCGTCSRSTYPH